MSGERYLGDVDQYRLHDLDNEQSDCQIDAIIDAGNDQPYVSAQRAHSEGHNDCDLCR
jgi:hypothetical protein